MPVEQPVLDTNYKHLKIIRSWPKTTMIKTSEREREILSVDKERERERERERENSECG